MGQKSGTESNNFPGDCPSSEAYSAALVLENLAQFYTDRRRGLLAQAFVMVRNWALAEDLTQETFARLLVEVKSGKTIQSAMRWTNTVLRHLALNYLEHNKVISQVIEPDSQLHLEGVRDSTLSAEENYFAQETRLRLQDALSQLAPLERECVLMFAEGHSYKEIAAHHNLAYGVTVDVIRRSIRKLRKWLSANRG
jgi:RNA polymerase sigma-70 factor (ECF subfamily)